MQLWEANIKLYRANLRYTIAACLIKFSKKKTKVKILSLTRTSRSKFDS